ncbi:autotransporter outer membrane beta-barrel domain-containing protein [Sphingomonas paucimobilis]|uniref:autotransporter outer membrane beta-barrel domain-containing protein n=1 Tax=Sphingomonas paucimobilis TaxID=13689 RepID=UPI0028D61E09|nr:autotransporter outer membrane beta-barrel domain-containing protein [Sphingomonas paucimobilis]
MHRLLFASTATLALVAGSAASAQTVIDTKRTTPVRTATVNNGAAGDISITTAGSVVTTGGTAVSVDSNNKIANAGTIQITDANDSIGIGATAGVQGEITNTGKIILDESYTPVDLDKDGDLDGPFAQGARRTGIRTAGAFTGAITNGGEITIEGNDSAGIFLAGPLTGNLVQSGKINVLGDRSVGVRTGAVSGSVTLGGTIVAVGQGAVGARIDGDVGGALTIEGAIGSTGYRYTTPPADISKLDPDDLLQGGSALIVGGNVAGGITLGNATGKAADLVSNGAAPAMQIGAADRAIVIGATGGATPAAGLVVNGRISGVGVYSGVTATGLAIGGLGGNVQIAQGVAVGGTVQANANGAAATAIRFGAGASTPELRNSGTISATGGGASATGTTAVLVDTGASLPTIRNSGSIKASAATASATAILDRTGGLTLVENNGAIAGAGADSSRSVAIDLSANSSGAVVRQIAPATGAAAPTITGAIRFGSGNDRLEIGAGTVSGDVSFGTGNNRLEMSGTGIYAGTATFGAGADTLVIGDTARFDGVADFAGLGQDTLSITGKGIFAGRLANAGHVAVTVASGGGTFAANGTTNIASLTMGDQSILSVALDKTNPTANLIQVGGATTIGANSQLALRVSGGSDVTGRYVVLRSGTLTGANNLSLAPSAMPFLYKGAIVASQPNEIAVEVSRKAKTELGLSNAGVSAFDAIDAAIGSDAKLSDSIRGIYDGAAFRGAIEQMLPNYAGGVFEGVTLASRTAAAQLREPAGEFSEEGKWGYWLSPLGWDSSKGTRSTRSYDVRGWGVSGGIEHKTDAGNFGASLSYLKGRDNEGSAVNRVDHSQYELAGFWRARWGALAAQARASAAFINFESQRQFDGVIGSEAVQRRATADWKGMLYSGSGSVSYEHWVGQFNIRPILAVDYYRLNEDGYREAGGGTGYDLTVRKRNSDELAVTASVAAGINFGGDNRYAQWSRLEVEAGRRERVAGALGRTVASFGDGTPFILDPEGRGGGWIGRVRAITGTSEIRLSGEVNAEQRLGNVALSARAALQFAF